MDRGKQLYRGADRRARLTAEAAGPPVGSLLKRAAPIVVVLVVVTVRGLGPLRAANALQVLGSLAAVAAGVAMLGCWKIGGRAAAGWLGIGLVDLGLLSAVYHSVSGIGLGPATAVEPYGRLIVCIIVASTLIAAIRSPEVDSGFRPLRSMGAAAFIGFLLLVSMSHLSSSLMIQRAVSATSALIWLGVAILVLRSLPAPVRFSSTWVAPCVFILALGAALRAAAPVNQWMVFAQQACFAAGLCVAVIAAGEELRRTVRSQDRYSFGLRTVLKQTQAEMVRERQDLDERLHDLRNAVTALRSADSTLRRYSSQLDEETRRDLANGLSSELSRLQTLIEPGRLLRTEEFLLADAVEPVLATERTRGLAIDARLERMAVVGDRDAVAQVLQNLLSNARTYAPDSKVRVQASRLSGRVQLSVSDHGPGIREDERAMVFRRGCRGSASVGTTGSGLGLHVASRLMADMGGSLSLLQGGAGAGFVMDLPAGRVEPSLERWPAWSDHRSPTSAGPAAPPMPPLQPALGGS